MARNENLHAANKAKKDEFYTQLVDIENELKHYKEHFKNKVVLCNCDDPRISNFFHYFSYNFEQLGLKKLITTCYKNQERDLFSQNNSERAIWLEYTGDRNGNRVPDPEEIGINYLKGDGDFRSEECINLLKQADIVVTNPPFSLFREYVAQLMKYEKKFVIVGNINAISYKEIFPLIKENKLWVGYGFNLSMVFKTNYNNELEANRKYVISKGFDPNEGFVKTPAVCWFTNLDIQKRHEDLILFKRYNSQEHLKYDNYDAIECCPVTEIPMDYYGFMGVPITFLDKYNPEQFEIVGICAGNSRLNKFYGIVPYVPHTEDRGGCAVLNGKRVYVRFLIRRKQSAQQYQTPDEQMRMAAEPNASYNKK